MAKRGGAQPGTQAGMPGARNVTDKFGMMLSVLSFVVVVVALFVWGAKGTTVGEQVLSAMFTMKKTDYDAQVTGATISGYAVGGYLNLGEGEVDAILIDRGYNDGVRLGDIFRPQQNAQGSDYFVEYSVQKLSAGDCYAVIILGNSRPFATVNSVAGAATENTPVSLRADVLEKRWPIGTVLERKWDDQIVRNKLLPIK